MTDMRRANASRPSHIAFVMVDDLGFNDISYRGTSDISSPNIDALALSGLRLARYYTHGLCSPSRTAFLSGRFAPSIAMQGCVIQNGHAVDMPHEVSTVADRLREGGFRTAVVGKWDAGMTTWDSTPNCRGFDYFFGFYGPMQDHFAHTYTDGSLDLRENFELVLDAHGVYSTHLYTRKATQWLRATLSAGSRTFLYLSYQAMHTPLQAPAEYVARCGHVTAENDRRTYCAMMLALDEGVAEVAVAYRALGAWEDTLLVLAADNGGHVAAGANNHPLRGEKASSYEVFARR
jgi:arylsulfatase B